MVSIGIEITNTEIKVGLCNITDKAELISEAAMPGSKDFSEALSGAAKLADELAANAGLSVCDIESAGFAIKASVCGTVAYNSVFGEAADFADFKKYSAVKEVKVVNRATALALAEERLTYGPGYSFAYISLDETIDFGIIIGSVPFTGEGGRSSDIAHTVINVGGKECTCKKQGCFEAYCALGAFESSDRKEYASNLSCGIVNIMNLFQPNMIVIGGKVMEFAGEELLAEINKVADNENYARNSKYHTQVALPTIGENGALIGAALA